MRRDLDIMEQAAGFGLPFDAAETRRAFQAGVTGLPLLAYAALGPTQPPYGGIAIAATLVVVFIVSSLDTPKARAERKVRPFAWREHRSGIAMLAVGAGAALGYLLVAVWGGVSWPAAMGTAIFFVGVATGLPALFDESHRHMFAGAIPTAAYGALFPLYDDRQLVLATALWIVLAGLATAGMMRVQLRKLGD